MSEKVVLTSYHVGAAPESWSKYTTHTAVILTLRLFVNAPRFPLHLTSACLHKQANLIDNDQCFV